MSKRTIWWVTATLIVILVVLVVMFVIIGHIADVTN